MATPISSVRFGNNNNETHFPYTGNSEEESRTPNIPPSPYGKGRIGCSSGKNSNSAIVGGNRDVEQRFACIVAEYEYKLLEERARTQEREAEILEELQQEKALASRLRRELSQQPQQGGSGVTLTPAGSAEGFVSREEHERLQKQLVETRDLLREAERRYHEEKRELFNLRTAQLRSETSKRGQEGDIIARAMQVMSEYEAVVRSGEESSLARLSRHVEAFEEEWLRRSSEFEQQKATFETSMMEKAHDVLSAHQQNVESITHSMLEKTTQALRSQSELRLEMEQEVLRHVEVFKEEYKSILEKEFYDRCRVYDEKLAERERGWVAALQEERTRIANAEREAAKEHEQLHAQSLESAMRELSRLREQLVREHREQQSFAMGDLIERRERMDAEHRKVLQVEVEAVISAQREETERVAEERDKLEARLAAIATAAQQQHEATAAAVARARRERDEMWHTKVEEMRKRYDSLLDEALHGGDAMHPDGCGVRARVSQSDYERAIRSREEWEQKCVTVKQQCDLLRKREQEQLDEIWSRRLDDERVQREVWEAAQLQCFAKMRLGLLQDVEERERRLVASLQEERDELHKELEEMVRWERNQCAATVLQAEEEAKIRCAAACEEQEKALNEKNEAMDAQIEEQRSALREREEALQEASRRFADETRQKALELIQGERDALQTTYDAKMNHLYEEQQRWETQRSIIHEELTSQYAERFNQAKEHMEQHLLTLTTSMLMYQQKREDDWFHLREDELTTLHSENAKYKELMKSRMAHEVKKVQAEMEAILDREREVLKEREGIMHETLQANQASMEEAAMERGLRLVEEQQRVLNEYCTKRELEQQERWNNMQSKLLEQTWAMEANQRALMQQQQRDHEIELDKECQRSRVELEEQRMEAQAQRQRVLEQQRQQETELRELHTATLEEARREHDALVTELRKEWEQCLAECKQRNAATLRDREAAFEAERKRLLEHMDTQSREQQESSNERVRALEKEYKNMLHTANVTAQESRQESAHREANLEQQYISRLEQQQRELRRKYDDHIAQLRSTSEARLQEYLAREADLLRRVEEQCEVLRVESEAKCRAFIAEQQDRVQREQQKREEAAQHLERVYCDHISELRSDMEATLSTYFADADSRSHKMMQQIRSEFEGKQQHFSALFEEERKRSEALENELRVTQAQMDSLQLTKEQQKLEALREMQQRYDGLYKEMHDALRKEREMWAKRALGEVEERLLKELTAREEKRRQQGETLAHTHTALGGWGSGRRPSEMFEGSSFIGPVGGFDDVASSSHPFQRSSPQTPYGRRTMDNNQVDVICGVGDDRLQQLWSVLEVPEAEQEQILHRWAQFPFPQRGIEVQKETRRLELQLPLLEVVTRREFVIHRLRELESSSSLSGSYSTQMEELRKELRRLTEHLKSEIPQHETVYGCTFRFRGARYMETILDDCSA